MNPPSVTGPAPRRLLVAGALTGLVLIGGAGTAHAGTSADAPADPGPSGYAVVVDDGSAPDGTAPLDRTVPTDLGDCPFVISATTTAGADR